MSAKSRGAKRLMQELVELEADPPPDFIAGPVEEDLFHWHFTLRLKNDEFTGGLYHGRLLMPPEYPLRPPEIYLLTPNGRFEPNKRICLSITGFHEDTWQPAWGIRTALLSLSAFFSTEAKGAIAGLDTPPAERRRLAKLSGDWTCPSCGKRNAELLPENLSCRSDMSLVEASARQGLQSPVHEVANLQAEMQLSTVQPPMPPPDSAPQPVSVTRIATTADPVDGTRIARPMTHVPPTLLDRLIVLLLIGVVGLLARSL